METGTILSILSLIVAALVGFTNIKRNQSADNRQAAAEMTTVIVKLDMINASVTEIKADVRNQRAELQELRDKVIAIEQSVKAAHHRIDTFGKGVTL